MWVSRQELPGALGWGVIGLCEEQQKPMQLAWRGGRGKVGEGVQR